MPGVATRAADRTLLGLRHIELRLVELSHGVPQEKLYLRNSLGTPGGTRNDGKFWNSTTPLEPLFRAKSLMYKDL
jgi:hypothetical protein